MVSEKQRQMKILKNIEGEPIVKSHKQSKSAIMSEIQAKFVHTIYIYIFIFIIKIYSIYLM